MSDCLPALAVLWLVVMLALHRGASIPNVFLRLRQAARERWGRSELPAVTDEALCHARTRLGIEPLVALFKKTADQIKPVFSLGGRVVLHHRRDELRSRRHSRE